MFKEFKSFALKGNVLDMAVGVIMGGAFGKIVSSLVNDVIMPLLGVILGGVDFTTLKAVLSPAVLDKSGAVVKAENALRYGQFIQNIVDFLIIALSIFVMIKTFNKLSELRHRKEEKQKQAEAAATLSKSEQLLSEIRDLLKEQGR